MLFVASDDMCKIGNIKLNILRDDIDGSKVVSLGEPEFFRFVFVSILFFYGLYFSIVIFFNFPSLFSWLKKSHLGGEDEMGERTVYYSFVYFFLENVLLNRTWLFEILQIIFLDLHHGTYVEVVNPASRLRHSKDWLLPFLVLPWAHVLFQDLFLIFLRIFFPKVKRLLGEGCNGGLHGEDEILVDFFGKFVDFVHEGNVVPFLFWLLVF